MVHHKNDKSPSRWTGAKPLPLFGTILVGCGLWMIPVPDGIKPEAWQLFSIFVATIVGIISRPLPMGAVSILAISIAVLTRTLTIEQSLSSVSSNVVWLVIFAFFLARGFIKTGLGTRVAYYFIGLLGRSSLGLSYGLAMTDFFLSPFIPSNTARGGGIVYPIVSSLAEENGSCPTKGSQRRLGGFLVKVCFHVNAVTSGMFLTAIVGNPLVASFASSVDVHLDWTTWAAAASVPGLLNLAILPWLIYKLYPPELTTSPDSAVRARKQLLDMGPLGMAEWLMLGTFFVVLMLWIFGARVHIEPTSAALLGVAFLLLSGVLTWSDLMKEKGAWETLIWFSVLLMMATLLNKMGFMDWFGQKMQGAVTGLSWEWAFIILSLVYFYSHYFFASITAHITALYAAFLVVLIAIGAPPMLSALTLAFLSSLSGSLTHYGTGTAPIYFGSGYVPIKDWWKISFVVSTFNLLLWSLVGPIWWKILGYW